MKCSRKTIFNLLKVLLVWCAAVSVYKTQEANLAAERRRKAREEREASQEWEFDRVYPGALRDR